MAALILGTILNDKPQLAVMLSDSLVEQGHDAGKIVKALAKHIQGGGGGQPFFATAGGKKVEGIAEAIGEAKGYLGKVGERI